MKAGQHSIVYITLLAVTWVVLLLTFFFNGISSVDAVSLNWGIFINTVGNISDALYLEITPAGWTFSIWGFIYAYQVIWMLYATANIFRKSGDGCPLYTLVPFLHWSIFIVYLVNLVCNIAWLFFWDRMYTGVALLPIMMTGFTMYLAAAMSIRGAFKYYQVFMENGFTHESRLILGAVTNAFGMYGTWVTVATLINLGAITTYTSGLPQNISSAIVLSVLTFEIMVWVLLDLAFLERYTRFLFTPYLVLIWALSGSLSKNYDATKPNSVITVMLLFASIAMFCVKIGLVIYREIKRPAFRKEKDAVVEYA